jgi:hypothetical protein
LLNRVVIAFRRAFRRRNKVIHPTKCALLLPCISKHITGDCCCTG